MLEFPLIEANKLSKVYKQNPHSNIAFEDVESAKQFFITTKAINNYNEHCYKQEWKLADNNKSLHWTISFKLDTKSSDTPDSDKWRDEKDRITAMDLWFQQGNHPDIVHDVEDLF